MNSDCIHGPPANLPETKAEAIRTIFRELKEQGSVAKTLPVKVSLGSRPRF